MCLAIPGRVIEVNGPKAKIEILGNIRETDLMLVGEAAVGEYLLIHAGYAIQKMTEEDANETLSLLQQAAIYANDV
ncbi:MAG: HypC/HybG/HupF family hydrogenase formation chaperone [Candidatus Sumerlaeota bacterium]|nr:HypC/HybG/HupF family hydrogenase formation chaperone [Candidatus Sumerlaeota bacterium]